MGTLISNLIAGLVAIGGIWLATRDTKPTKPIEPPIRKSTGYRDRED